MVHSIIKRIVCKIEGGFEGKIIYTELKEV